MWFCIFIGILIYLFCNREDILEYRLEKRRQALDRLREEYKVPDTIKTLKDAEKWIKKHY